MFARITTIARGMLCLAVTGIVLAIAASHQARAQSFEYHYGGNCFEGGHGGVQPVSTGGYISVGISQSGPNGCISSDIYVVKSNNNGTLAWSRTYNIGVVDTAWDIRECSNGDFIIVGTTDTNTACQKKGEIFLLRISSAGAVVWAKTYGESILDEYGRCVIQTTRSAGGPTAAGDFVVAGWRIGVDNVARAYLFRTNSTGVMIWDGAYTDPNANASGFSSVVESTIGAGAGDVVAVGAIWRSTIDAYMVRVNGASGGFTGGTHGTLIVGGDSTEGLRTVQELTIGAEAGNIVAIGKSVPVDSVYGDIYIIKTGANPSAGPLLQHLYHASNCIGDEGIWIREITSASPGFTQGNLICAGNNVIVTGSSAFLMEVVPATLAFAPSPANVGFQRYGLPLFNWSKGYSVAVVSAGAGRTPGFILAGSSANGADPSQLYLVKTSTTGISCSNQDTPVEEVVPQFPWTNPNPTKATIMKHCGITPTQAPPVWSTKLCFTNSTRRVDQEDPDGAESVSSVDDQNGAVSDEAGLYPNPVPSGSTLTVEYLLPKDGDVTISVSDIAGKTIHSAQGSYHAGELRIPVSTEGWSTGIYLVKVSAGGASRTGRVIVIDN